MVSSSDCQWSQSSNLFHLKFRILFIPSTSAGVLCSVVAQDWGRCGQDRRNLKQLFTINGKRPAIDDTRCGFPGTIKRQRTVPDNWDGETQRPVDDIPPEYHRYTIAWICALPTELVAAEAMLDEKHDVFPSRASHGNTYTIVT
ncbi:hypothetical protein CCUS01_01557 [Colletotrichum cuscutae]|uniref:Uncharacterized protein n=1 Tax=Colletotrichum cuscutae TaxID=1209917 RepID=A0AAI9UNW5_9PEZI|nr:hypothetical protein CCUS01_01557 [Colletotrichum cuscutae]